MYVKRIFAYRFHFKFKSHTFSVFIWGLLGYEPGYAYANFYDQFKDSITRPIEFFICG